MGPSSNRALLVNLEVHNVAAMVLPASIVPENLLGLSFLRRLRRFEYMRDGRLVLEQ
jgi:aspartyl protease family protein